ncbi:MAG TPA: substrate-binding domain-containing protein [Micropepsaceae bacterium]|nr:substrate-binding domain-containing protein [Micropepsaceae bacterium]
MSKSRLLPVGGMVSALALTSCLLAMESAPARAATTPIYGGGSTLAELYYRQVFSCYGSNSTAAPHFLGALPAACNGSTGFTAPYNTNVELLYAGSGSGGGTSAYDTQDKSFAGKVMDPQPLPYSGDFNASGSAFYGTNLIGASYAPAANTNEYPLIHYGASDYSFVPSDVAAASASAYGALQFPTLVTPIALPFTPLSAGWTPKGLKGAGGTSFVDLSTKTVCGIFTGQITDWSDPAITADNKGTKLGTGQITVVYRSDGSGTSFIFSNALITQCALTGTAIPTQWITDQGAAGGSGTSPNGANQKFFLNVVNHGHIPAAAHFVGGNGSEGVELAIDGTPGAIGYLSPNFAQPILTGNDSHGNPIAATANVQTLASLIAGTKKFVAPTPTTTKTIMTKTYGDTLGTTNVAVAIKAPSFSKASCVAGNSTGTAPHVVATDGICADNPLNWGITNPSPSGAGAYPFGGFSFHFVYRCYATQADRNAMASATAGALGMWRWYFGSTTENSSVVKNLTLAHGFAQVPGGFISGVKKLLTTNKPTEISYVGNSVTGVPACASGPSAS